MIEKLNKNAEIVFRMASDTVLRMEKGVEHFSVNIELELKRSSIPNAHRLRAFVSREPADFPFDKLPLAFDAVHDLDLIGTSRKRTKQPILPCQGLVEIASVGEREQRKCRVPQPAIAIVPIALASNGFRQRSRNSGDDSSSGPEGQGL